MKIYIATDHAGFETKNILLAYVQELGYEVEDCGAYDFDINDDYPEIIARAGKKLSDDAQQNIQSRAIVLGASGQGEAMVMNRFVGVRCALFYGEPCKKQVDATGSSLDVIISTREHNNANALSIGARFVSADQAKDAVSAWLAKPFSGVDRHARRIAQIDAILSA